MKGDRSAQARAAALTQLLELIASELVMLDSQSERRTSLARMLYRFSAGLSNCNWQDNPYSEHFELARICSSQILFDAGITDQLVDPLVAFLNQLHEALSHEDLVFDQAYYTDLLEVSQQIGSLDPDDNNQDFTVDSQCKEQSDELRILVVEDNLVNQKVIGKMLSNYGSCDFAEDGKSGLIQFLNGLESHNPYDLVMLDIMMPNMDGQTLLRLIRLSEAEHQIHGMDGTKIVMTTALDDKTNILGAFREGCEGYLIKPIEREAMGKLLLKLNMHPKDL